MTNFSDQNINEIYSRQPKTRFTGMQDVLLPDYDGFNSINILPTISSLLGGPELTTPELAASIRRQLPKRVKRVVLILVDALGLGQFTRWMQEDKLAFWPEAVERGNLFALTSVCPSTTASALSSILSGSAPGEHGVIGYEMWLKSLGMSINNILHSPTAFKSDPGGLARAGFDTSSFLGAKTAGQYFSPRKISTDIFLPNNITGSGLSQMHLAGAQSHGYINIGDLWYSLRDLLNTQSKNRGFVYVYWSDVDTLMHRFGVDNPRGIEQLALFSESFRRIVFDGLEEHARQDTLFLLTADHGAIDTPYYPEFDLKRHPDLNHCLAMLPTCETRLPFIYLKPGCEEAFRQYVQTTWPDKFSLISRQEARDLGLLGPGPYHADFDNRVGDLVAIAHDDAYLWWPDKPNVMAGRHGGLHPDEMLVPLLSFCGA